MPRPPEKEISPKCIREKCPETIENTLNSHFGCPFSASYGRDRVHTTISQVGLGNPSNYGNSLGKLKNRCPRFAAVLWDCMLNSKTFVLLSFLNVKSQILITVKTPKSKRRRGVGRLLPHFLLPFPPAARFHTNLGRKMHFLISKSVHGTNLSHAFMNFFLLLI